MNNKIITTKEFNVTVKAAKAEFNGYYKSPFIVINLFNKFASGKVKNVDGLTCSHDNFTKVAKVLKAAHGGNYAFTADVLQKQGGVFVTLRTAKKCPKHGLLLQSVDKDGWHYWQPIALTADALFNAFANIAKDYNKDINKAAKAEEKAAKAAKKAADKVSKARAKIEKLFGKELTDTLTDTECLEKAAKIKGK